MNGKQSPSTNQVSTEELQEVLATMPPVPVLGKTPAASAPAKPTTSLDRSQHVGPLRKSPGQPGALLRTSPGAPVRNLPGMWAGPSEVQERNRERVKAVRKELGSLIDSTNKGIANVKAYTTTLRNVAGGAAEADKEGFDLAAAEEFLKAFEGVLDKFAPVGVDETEQVEAPM